MLVGLLGHPLEHSLSPLMHNAAMKTLKIEGKYLLFDVSEDSLKKSVERLCALGAVGFNVTIPYKRKIIDLLDEITPQAAEIGAVNLVYKKDVGGKAVYVGDNSDAPGFIASLQSAGVDLHQRRALVLGAGGAARAVAAGLKNEGVEVIVASRRKPEESFWNRFPWEELRRDLVVDADLVVNCTPCGMYPNVDDELIVNPASFPKKTCFCDIVYNPLKTRFIQVAQETGHKTVTGEGMLLFQGAISFTKWYGQEAPIGVMKQVLLSYLQGGEN